MGGAGRKEEIQLKLYTTEVDTRMTRKYDQRKKEDRHGAIGLQLGPTTRSS